MVGDPEMGCESYDFLPGEMQMSRMTQDDIISFCNKTLEVHGIAGHVVLASAQMQILKSARIADLIEYLRAGEGSLLELINDNPDFNCGASCVVTYYEAGDFGRDKPQRFEGPNLEACLEHAWRWTLGQRALPQR